MRKSTVTFLIVVAIFALGSITGCSGKERHRAAEKVTIAVYNFPGSAALYVALDKGYFGDEGLDVTLDSYTAAPQALQAAISGKAELGTSADTVIARAALDGRPVAVIATIAEIERGVRIIARRDRGISSPADLRGKRIGMVAGTTTEFFLHAYLTVSGIRPGDVEIISLAPEKFNDALLNGEVDAASANAPYNIVLRDKLGSNAVSLDDRDIYRMTWNVSAAREFVRNNPERVTKFLRAVLRANDFIEARPAEARSISAKYIGADSPLYEKEWKDYESTLVLDQALILSLEDQARWMASSKGDSSQKIPNFLDFIYADGLKAVQPDAVRITIR